MKELVDDHALELFSLYAFKQNNPHIVVLNLRDCKSLKSLPAGIHLEFLKELDLLNGTAIEELPSAIECLYKLLHLDLEYCESLNSLPSGLCKLKLLNYLTLNCCSNLQRLPDELGNLEALWISREAGVISRWLPENIGQLSSLGKLDLQKNNFERIPESVIQLSKLGRLYLRYWERLQSLPKLPCKLHELDAHHCTALESLSGLFSSFEARTRYFDLRYNYNWIEMRSEEFLKMLCKKLNFWQLHYGK
ncbi:hypothetical protein CISIN_1g041505mg, partial [Citrus sinensis]